MNDEQFVREACLATTSQCRRQDGRIIAVFGMLIFAALALGGLLFGSSATSPARPPYLKGAALASRVIEPRAQMRGSSGAGANIVISDIVPMTMPNSYIGVGDQLAVQRSGDPNMQVQNFWLSIHSPGTPKWVGDPFMSKWDNIGGCYCWPVGGPFQPDYDGQGYDYALYVPNGTSGYLQVYDAAYQPKPGTTINNVAVSNDHFDHYHPCGNPNTQWPNTPLPGTPTPLPFTCLTPTAQGTPEGPQDFNDRNRIWCASNSVHTSDNEPGASGVPPTNNSQCNPQVVNATTVYSLYYPDSTPYYFGDDVLATSWAVPASHLPDPNDSESTNTYSDTWANFADAPNPGYLITPTNGYNIWRLNVNVPFDGDHTMTGTLAENNYAIRLKTSDSGVQVFPSRRYSPLVEVPAGVSDSLLAEVPASQAGRVMVVSLFDIGDASGINYIQLVSPPTASDPTTHTVFFNAHIHDNHNPPGQDTVYTDINQLNTTRPAYDTNDKWVDLVYYIPPNTDYLGGSWSIRYIFQQQAQDHTTWWLSISDNNPYITPVPSSTPTNTPVSTGTPTDTATNTPVPTSTPVPTDTVLPPTDTPVPSNTPAGPSNTPALPSVTPTDCANPFVDITGNIFYPAIHYLDCRGVVNGTDATHYSPASTSTRGQFAKVVVLGFGLTLYTPSGGQQDFVDVPPSYFAYLYIESGFYAGILSGFDSATCLAHGFGTPCYLPNIPITRGQLTKLVVGAAGYPFYTPTGGSQDFSDVPPSNVFFASIETAYHKGVINGYLDHTFQPNNNIRRDEMAQIVYKGVITP